MTDYDARLPDPADDRDELDADAIAAESGCIDDDDISELAYQETDAQILAWAKGILQKMTDAAESTASEQKSDGDE